MSVLIKGMKMPRSCSECGFRLALGCCGNLPQNTRVPTCPLIEIPPHGRLIDADALKETNPRHMNADVPYVTEVTVEEIIDDAPTIIEAEGTE